MSETTACPLCSKRVSFAGIKKHIFSKEHAAIWGEQAVKKAISDWYKEQQTAPQFYTAIPIITPQKVRINVCFECKFYSKTDKSHRCKDKEATMKKVKEMLGDFDLMDTPIQDNKVYLNKIKGLESAYQQIEEEHEELLKALKESLKLLHPDAYDTMIKSIRENYFKIESYMEEE